MHNSGPRQRTSRHTPALWHRVINVFLAVILAVQTAFSPVTALGANSDSGGSSSGQTGYVEVHCFATQRPEGSVYPKITYELYKSADNGSSWEKVAEKTITESDYAAGLLAVVKFENLDAYASSGVTYEYKVKQLALDYYTTHSRKAVSDNDDFVDSNEVAGLFVADTGTKYDNEALFYNTPKTVTIKGTVDWKDNDNAWNTRADIYDTLVITRALADGSNAQEVTLQQSDSTKYNYFNWTSDNTWSGYMRSGSNYTSFFVANLEKYTSDGQEWVYTLKQDSSKVAADSTLNQYTLATGTLSKTNETDLAVTLTNTLKSTVGVTVAFEDEGDAYQQRPRVYVELQASTDGGQTWYSARSVLGFGAVNDKRFEQYWTPGTDGDQFTFEWDQLPASSNNEFLTASSIIYRVRESKLAYDATSTAGFETKVVTTSVDKDGNYAKTTGAYAPSQTTVTSDYLATTGITNSAKSTSTLLVAGKWNDGGAKWLRPSTVTYLLQRKAGNGDWEWVTKYNVSVDSPFDVYGETINDNLVQLTLSDADTGEGELSNTWSKTFQNLPAVDYNDEAYAYRAVEVVPTGYHVTTEGATEVASSGSLKLYAAGEGDVTFENTTDQETVTLFGIVLWERRNFARPDPSSLDFQLLQYKGQDDTNPTSIPLGQTSLWWASTSTDRWQYSIEGLPKTAEDGTAYYYKFILTPGSSAGYRTENPTVYASDYDGALYGGVIKNTVTCLALDKVGTAGGQAAQLNDVELTVKDASGNVVAVWSRDSQGEVTVAPQNGYTWGQFVGCDVSHIFGLPAGTYTVSETKTPANYLTAADVEVTIGVDGTVTTTSSNATAKDSGYGCGAATDLITVSDEALRGSFDVTLTAGDDETPVAGMTFDLYKDDGTLLAKSLTTDEKGVFASATSNIAYEANAGLGSGYGKLCDGLPVGYYYLVQTGGQANLVIPSGSDAKTSFSIHANGDATQQPATQHVTVNNKLFSASVYLTLADVTADSFDVISGAKFELKYKALGSDEYITAQELVTDEDGEVWFKGLKKGSYTLTEVSNTGYNVGEDGLKALDFVIDNDDAGQDRDLGDAADRASLDATNVDQSIVDYECMVNERLTGTATMKKVDEFGRGIAGAVFKLQAKAGDGSWADVEGKTNLTSAANGTVTASGLAWGTYRFAEVSQAAGYAATSGEVSQEVTIGRDNVATAQDCGTVTNYSVGLTLKKAYKGVDLKGAEFTVTPAAGSTFADGTSSQKTFTTGDDGTVSLSGVLAVGNQYLVKESVAPDGYMLSTAELAVKVGDNGSIEVVGEKPAAFTVDGTTVTLEDEPTGAFYVIKANEAGMPLSGAEFELSGEFATGALAEKLAVNEYGLAYLDAGKLVAGNTYTLKETKAPAGYKLCSDELKLTVNADGKLEVVGEKPAAFTVHADAAAVVMTDEATGLTVTKLADDGQSKLAGAEFTVTPAEGSAFADGTTDAKALATGTDGTATLAAQLVAGNTYTLAETKAPAGYKQTAQCLTFTVATDGSLEVQGESVPAGFTVDGTSVAVAGERTTFSVTKANENGDPLSDATFKLTGSFADGSTSQTLTTGNDGAAALAGLLKADGTTVYTLRETAAPKGYTLNLDKFKFTVGTDGTITAAQGDHAVEGYQIATNGTSVVATDTTIAPVTATIAVTKKVEGDASLVADQAFSFEMRDCVNVHAPGKTLDGVKAGDTASFAAITYTQPGFYKYIIHEKNAGLGLGWTLAADQYVEVTVLQNEDKSLQTPVVKYASNAYATSALFTNRYDQATGEFQLSLKATVNGKAPREGQTFRFLAAATGQDADSAPQLSDVETSADGTASFSAASLGDADAGKTYTYTIHQVSQLGDGWTAAGDVTATVTVGTRDADGKLPVTVTYDGVEADAATFNNTYAAAGELELNVCATVNGGAYATDREFELGLYETNESGEKTGEPVSTVRVKAGQVASFEGITYDQDDAGQTVTYAVSELGELGDGWTKAADQKVKVTVTDNDDGSMTAAVDYPAGQDALVFDNTYTAAGELVVRATVDVNSGTYQTDKDFQLGLFETDESGAKKGEAIATATVKAGQTAVLSGNFYGQDDAGQTITYVVSEMGELGDGWTKAADQTVKVAVTDNGQGLVVASVDYGVDAQGQKKTALAFSNTYAATGAASIAVAKQVNGADPADDAQFSFSLAAVTEGAPMPKASSVTTTGAAAATFGDIAFDLADAGKTYEYKIHETTPATTGWTMAADVTVRVTVGADNGDGTLEAAKVEYSSATDDGAAALFNNAYEQAAGQFQLALVKTVNGSVPTIERSFTFSATAEGANAANAPQLSGVTTGEDGSAVFSAVTLKDADEGQTYTYRIHETSQLGDAWITAPDVIATVQVSRRSLDNQLAATVTYRQDADGAQSYAGAAAFDNKYAASAELSLNVTATANGGAYETDREFAFGLFETDGFGNKTGEPVSTVTVKAGQIATFTGVFYDQDNDGDVITYVVSQTNAAGNGWANAVDQTVDVAVADNGDGTMEAQVSYPDLQYALVFDNTYSCAGELELNVAKTVNGGEWTPDREFTFGLYETNADGEKTGEPVSTVTVKAGQTATFDGVFYDLDNAGQVITYVVSELGEAGDGWTNAADQKVAVSVSDDRDGTMTAAVDYGQGKTALTFDNTYRATATFGVKKTVNGGALSDGESFSFSLYQEGQDGAEKIGSATVDAQSPAAAFEALAFTKPGTYTYTVSEDANLDANWMNADDVAVTFEVTEAKGNDGQVTGLDVTLVEQAGGASDYSRVTKGSDGTYTVSFNNAYYSEATAVLKARGEVTGATDSVAGKEFKYELKDASGQVIDTKTAKAGQTVAFDALSFTRNMRGAHTYAIAVSAADGDATNWTFQGEVMATVTVGMDETNRKVEVKSIEYARDGADCSYTETDGSKSALFIHTYTAPVEPDAPDMPEQPDTPDTPATPEQPAAPATPESPAQAQKPAGTPQTGDASASALLTLVPAGLFLLAAGLLRRRRNQG